MNPTDTPSLDSAIQGAAVPSLLYPAVSADKMLRIGLLVDSDHVPAWVAHIVGQIQTSDFARVVMVIVNEERPRAASFSQKVRTKLRHALYERYTDRDIARRRGPGSAFASSPLRPLIGAAEWLTVEPKRSGFVHRLREPDLDKIRAADCDVLLRFGFNILRGDILDVARHGMWSYHHDDSAQYRGGPAMFWEIHEANPVTGTVLQRLTEELDAGGILYSSHASTHPHSLELNRDPAYWKASSFVMRCLRRLASKGQLEAETPQPCNKPLYRTPRNLQMMQFLGRTAMRKGRALLDSRLRVPHWFVAWRQGEQPIDPSMPRVGALHELPAPHGHFYADPFLHAHQGQPWLFVEDFDYLRGKASLAVIPWGGAGPDGPARTILELDVHLSYPFVFEWQGQTYLLPETAEADRASLFRARRFPDQWEFVCDLLHGFRIVDATLHEHEGHWYLFANLCEAGGGTFDELFLFHAQTPLGPFLPHPANPIVSDVRRARPGGRLFRHAGRLIRPSQDCAAGYGHALVFNEVHELGTKHYRERSIGRLAPDWAPGLTGCHTYARLSHAGAGWIEVFDGKRPTLRRRVGAPRE